MICAYEWSTTPKNSGHAYIDAGHVTQYQRSVVNASVHTQYGRTRAKEVTSCQKAKNYTVKWRHPKFLASSKSIACTLTGWALVSSQATPY